MPVQQTTQRWVVLEDGSRVRGNLPPEVVDEGYAIPRTHAEADEQAAERGLTFPNEEMTVKEKQDFLASS
jgi:hypothetical protein